MKYLMERKEFLESETQEILDNLDQSTPVNEMGGDIKTPSKVKKFDEFIRETTLST